MKAAQLLDAAKERLCLSSDYSLAKKAGIQNNHIAEIRSGKRAAPLRLLYWLAITLERDPAALVAEVEEEREKNEGRKAFWRFFLSHAQLQSLALCMLTLASFGTGGNAQAASGGQSDRPGAVRIIRSFVQCRLRRLMVPGVSFGFS